MGISGFIRNTQYGLLLYIVKALKMPFYKVGRWAELTVFKQYLWNGWTDLKNRLAKKDRPHRGTNGRSLILFGSMTSSHEQKRTLFFCPSVTLFLGYSSFISLEDIGRKISGLLTPIEWTYFCLEFWLETGEFEEKVKKEVFWMGKNRQIFLFLYHASPTGLPDDFSGFYYFFSVRRHVSEVPFFTDEHCRT